MAQPHRRGLWAILDRNGHKVDCRLDQRAEHPLGLLSLLGEITDSQYEACRLYAGVVLKYLPIVGAPRHVPPSMAGMLVGVDGGGGEISIEESNRRREIYDSAFEALAEAGWRAARAVARMAVWGQELPMGCELEDLRRGADRLAAHFRVHFTVASPSIVPEPLTRIMSWRAPLALGA